MATVTATVTAAALVTGVATVTAGSSVMEATPVTVANPVTVATPVTVGNPGHEGTFANAGGFGNRNNPAMWHHDSHGSTSFFGTPARPSASQARWNTQESAGRSSTALANTSTHWWSNAGAKPA